MSTERPREAKSRIRGYELHDEHPIRFQEETSFCFQVAICNWLFALQLLVCSDYEDSFHD